MKIRITDDCIGCGACEAVCPAYFKVNDKAVAKNPVEKEDEAKVKEACDACPVDAIKIE